MNPRLLCSVSAVRLLGYLCWANRAGSCELKFPLAWNITPRAQHIEDVQPKIKVKAYCVTFFNYWDDLIYFPYVQFQQSGF